MSPWSRFLYWFFGIVLAIVLILKLLTVYTDWLWFLAMGQGAVFATIFRVRVGLGLVLGLAFFGWMLLNVRIARRPLPEGLILVGRRLLSDEEREQVEQYMDRMLLIFCIMAGLLVGLVASSHWLDYIHFRNPVPFGYTDPLFGRDASFYVFRLPFMIYLWRVVFYGFSIALIVSVLVHFYQEAIRIVGNTVHAIPRARAHILLLLAGALATKAVGYRLDMFRLTLSPRGQVFFGACYADVHGRLPVMWILMGLCAIAAIICLLSIRGRRFLWPGGALAVVIVFAVLGGWAYPALLQRLVVKPNQLAKERKFIEYNIQATNVAYKLNEVHDTRYAYKPWISWEKLMKNRATLENVRLWDHRPLEQTFQHTQALRAYYAFSDVDVDRYVVDGRYRQVMLAARQLDYRKIPPPQTWVKTYLQYTHGYGLCVAPVTDALPEGLPVLWVRDIPPVAVKPELKVDRPALYYMASLHPRLIEYISPPEEEPPTEEVKPKEMEEVGEQPKGTRRETARRTRTTKGVQTDYVIVNTTEWELDYPRVGAGVLGEGANVLTRYKGRGGVPISSFFHRLAFAARFMDLQILLTTSVKPDSRILINRYLPERFHALAPWLMYDPDPYLVIIDGKLKWMCDAYTVSQWFPYSHKIMLGINYIRNSVKIVCDAYDGIPEYYVYDPSDPLIQCYMKVFPTLFRRKEQMPAEVRKHVRYPQLLFILQAEVYADYHMKDPETFYQREDSWSIPVEYYSRGRRLVEAYYVIMKLPGEEKEEFVIMLPLTLRGREERVMVAWMAARCDEPNYGELIVYRLPKGTLCYGPMQVEFRINQHPTFSELQTLWGQLGSRVIRGNLLAIPVDNSMLYVEPIYLVSTESGAEGEGGLPELRMVVAAMGDRIGLGRTLWDALADLYGKPVARGIAAAEEKRAARTVPGAPAPQPGDIKTLIERALKLDDEAKALLRQGDLAGYQRKQEEQRQILEQLRKMAGPGAGR